MIKLTVQIDTTSPYPAVVVERVRRELELMFGPRANILSATSSTDGHVDWVEGSFFDEYGERAVVIHTNDHGIFIDVETDQPADTNGVRF